MNGSKQTHDNSHFFFCYRRRCRFIVWFTSSNDDRDAIENYCVKCYWRLQCVVCCRATVERHCCCWPNGILMYVTIFMLNKFGWSRCSFRYWIENDFKSKPIYTSSMILHSHSHKRIHCARVDFDTLAVRVYGVCVRAAKRTKVHIKIGWRSERRRKRVRERAKNMVEFVQYILRFDGTKMSMLIEWRLERRHNAAVAARSVMMVAYDKRIKVVHTFYNLVWIIIIIVIIITSCACLRRSVCHATHAGNDVQTQP